jgi:hypothetical protein
MQEKSFPSDGKVHVKRLKDDQCTICPDACPPIIDRKTWEKVQERLGGPRRSGRYPAKFFLLRGVVRCWCGSHMTCDGRYQRYYRCRSTQIRRGCRYACHTRAEILEETVMRKLLKVLKGLCVDGEMEKYIESEPQSNNTADIEILKKELGGIERGIRNLLDLAQYGQAAGEIQERIGELSRRKEAVIGEIRKIEQSNESRRSLSAGELRQRYGELSEVLKSWEKAPSEVREVLSQWVRIRYNGHTGYGVMTLLIREEVEESYGFWVAVKNRR